jgi:hypothetical protein
MADVSSLLSADEMSDKLKGVVSAERLVELSQAGMAPHYLVDGRIMFGAQETKEWVNHNLVIRRQGRHLGDGILTVVNVMPSPRGDQDVPATLSAIAGMLISVPVASAETVKQSGVYFLCDGGAVVYVGQSTNVFGRVGAHIGHKTFDRIYFVRVPQTDLNFVEACLINQLRPKYNISKDGRLVMPISEQAQQRADPVFADSNDIVTAMSLYMKAR